MTARQDPALRRRYLRAMDIPLWVSRDRPPAALPADPGAAPGEAPATARARGQQAEDRGLWEALRTEVSACTACPLHATRTQTVFGTGSRTASLMVIGEAPGADEDRQGEPFVGRAGRLLNAMLFALGYAREDVYIANILKCRPPQNRDPKPAESETCTPFLDRQIELLQPKALLAVGRISAQWLLATDTPIGKLRGRVHSYSRSQTPVVVTYHPAYLLRSPLAKGKSWQDLLLVKELLDKDE